MATLRPRKSERPRSSFSRWNPRRRHPLWRERSLPLSRREITLFKLFGLNSS